MNVAGSGGRSTEVRKHVGRGYLGGWGDLARSSVRITSDNRRVLAAEGEVRKSRLERERGVDDGR